jgi:hypothetical protein
MNGPIVHRFRYEVKMILRFDEGICEIEGRGWAEKPVKKFVPIRRNQGNCPVPLGRRERPNHRCLIIGTNLTAATL